MHQIRFRLGLRPRLCSPTPLSWILRGPTSKRREERWKREDTGRERGESWTGGKGKGQKRKWQGREGRRAPQIEISGYVTGYGRAKRKFHTFLADYSKRLTTAQTWRLHDRLSAMQYDCHRRTFGKGSMQNIKTIRNKKVRRWHNLQTVGPL